VKIFNNPEDWLVSKNTHGAIMLALGNGTENQGWQAKSITVR